ncbi:hypothetical protein PG987_010281 [Apiospora arundinis]
MVQIDSGFAPATIPAEEVYEGTEVDPHVLALLPEDCQIVWANTRGASFWAVNYKIVVQPSGEEVEKSYFMKVFLHERGREMVEAEYESTKAWQPSQRQQVVRHLEEWFTRAMKSTMEIELQVQGPHPELKILNEKILTRVIPRLLRPMETNGRKIKPALVHGDLWHGNVGVDNGTGVPVLYDCGSFYGHNEFDFSCWRAERYQTNRAHADAYFRIAEKSEPVADFEDRYALYAA